MSSFVPEGPTWIRSTVCASTTCLEVAIGEAQVMLRNSTSPEGPEVAVTRDEWQVFLQGAKNGDFDLS